MLVFFTFIRDISVLYRSEMWLFFLKIIQCVILRALQKLCVKEPERWHFAVAPHACFVMFWNSKPTWILLRCIIFLRKYKGRYLPNILSTAFMYCLHVYTYIQCVDCRILFTNLANLFLCLWRLWKMSVNLMYFVFLAVIADYNWDNNMINCENSYH